MDIGNLFSFCRAEFAIIRVRERFVQIFTYLVEYIIKIECEYSIPFGNEYVLVVGLYMFVQVIFVGQEEISEEFSFSAVIFYCVFPKCYCVRKLISIFAWKFQFCNLNELRC